MMNYKALLISLLTPIAQAQVIYDGPIERDIILSNDGLTVSAVRGKTGGVQTSTSVESGRHYWEVTLNCGPDTAGGYAAISKFGSPLYGAGAEWFGITGDDMRKWSPTLGGSPIPFSEGRQPTLAGDTFMLALDMNAAAIHFGKNGLWLGGSDPETGANPAFAGLQGPFTAAITSGARECSPLSYTTNFGATEFAYKVPDGYFKGFCPTGDCAVEGFDVSIQTEEETECLANKTGVINASAIIQVSEDDPVSAIRWYLDGTLVGTTETISINTDLGVHALAVEVEASSGDLVTESTEIAVIDTAVPEIDIEFIGSKGQTVYEITRSGLHTLSTHIFATDQCDGELVTESTGGVSIENQQPFQIHATQEEVVLGGRTFILRAEATDSSGNTTQKTATLSIVD